MICGIDEAGRGPLAGPVTAAAVSLGVHAERLLASGLLRDSKQLSANQRYRAAREISRSAPAWALGWAWPQEIDKINIHAATLLAMQRAVAALSRGRATGLAHPGMEILVDGRFLPVLPYPARAIVGGDRRIAEIMAASIMAKTARDKWMIDYSRAEPRYGFERHKGYPTRLHRERLAKHGPCPIHRRSFRLVDPS